jgi:Dolichyl-phosphate-mannose-protein mannosyltransferase
VHKIRSDVFPNVTRYLAHRLTWAIELLERRQVLAAMLLVAFIVLSALGSASHKSFTYDEQITYRTGRMPVHQIWSFFSQGLDTTGPVTALIAHPALAMRQSPEIAERIPFILAFAVMCIGLWSFLRARYPAGFALAAMILPLEFATLTYFRTDARAYALMLCAAGAGMRLWQMASENKARPWSVLGLWFVLALGMSAHFFTVFLFVPLAAAQLVLDRDRRRIDWPVWAALLLFPLGWLPFAPGEMRAHALYAGSFWSKPTLANLSDAYEQMITPNWTILFVLGLFILCLALWRWRSGSRAVQCSVQPGYTGLRKAEWVLVLALLALPPIVWCAAHAIGAFHHYYTDSFAAGLIVAIAAAAAECSLRQKRAGLLFFVMIVSLVLSDNFSDAVDGFSALLDQGHAHEQNAMSFQAIDWVRSLNQSELPVVADNAVYARLAFYGTPALAARSYALTNFSDAGKYPLALTDQNNMKLFGKRLGFQEEDILAFMQQHPRFLLVQQRTPFPYEWTTDYLLEYAQSSCKPQIQVRSMSNDGQIFIFEVSPNPTCADRSTLP